MGVIAFLRWAIKRGEYRNYKKTIELLFAGHDLERQKLVSETNERSGVEE